MARRRRHQQGDAPATPDPDPAVDPEDGSDNDGQTPSERRSAIEDGIIAGRHAKLAEDGVDTTGMGDDLDPEPAPPEPAPAVEPVAQEPDPAPPGAPAPEPAPPAPTGMQPDDFMTDADGNTLVKIKVDGREMWATASAVAEAKAIYQTVGAAESRLNDAQRIRQEAAQYAAQQVAPQPQPQPATVDPTMAAPAQSQPQPVTPAATADPVAEAISQIDWDGVGKRVQYGSEQEAGAALKEAVGEAVTRAVQMGGGNVNMHSVEQAVLNRIMVWDAVNWFAGEYPEVANDKDFAAMAFQHAREALLTDHSQGVRRPYRDVMQKSGDYVRAKFGMPTPAQVEPTNPSVQPAQQVMSPTSPAPITSLDHILTAKRGATPPPGALPVKAPGSPGYEARQSQGDIDGSELIAKMRRDALDTALKERA